MNASMQTLASFTNEIDIVFTDIDDTLTDEGVLRAEAYSSLWNLHEAGIKIVPVTGRPAGWCEMIARFWPVHGVIGENGGFYFRYLGAPSSPNQTRIEKKMKRHFVLDEKTMAKNREALDLVRYEILRNVRGAAVASDQFSRLMDLAIDFAEDVGPLSETTINQIVSIFEKHGATAKVSSIHVNGWFGSYDKLSTTKVYCENELGFKFESAKSKIAFCGDSPNDEPMFEAFTNSFAVANIVNFAERLKFKPAFVSEKNGGRGFVQIANRILELRK